MTKKRITNPCIKADVIPELKSEFKQLAKDKGYQDEAAMVRSWARNEVIKHRTTTELLRLQRIECEKAAHLKLNDKIYYDDNGQVREIYGCISAKTPIL